MTHEFVRGRLLRGASLGAIFACCLPLAAPAYAQARAGAAASPEATAGSGELAEIVVTAQKRTEYLSKTPLAISVIGMKTLDDVGARSFTDAARTLPNVSSGLGSVIAIRGLGTSTLNSNNGTVAFHIDGIFQNGIGQASAGLYDIQRIEVLRGPQGTLYGRNATAGVVNVLTSDASQKLEAFGDVSYASYNTLGLRGVVNVPLGDKFAVRLTGTYDKNDSYRVTSGRHAPGDDVKNLRLAWKATPLESVTWDGRLEYNDKRNVQAIGVPYYFYKSTTQQFLPTGNDHNSAQLPSVTGTNGLQTAVGFPYGSVYKGIGSDDANRIHVESIAARSKLRVDVSDALSLTYLAGYTNIVTHAGAMTSGLVALQISAARQQIKDWSHELDLNFETDRIKLVLGGYSFQHDQRQPGGSFNRIFGPTPALTAASAGTVLDYTVPLIDSGQTTPDDRSVTRAIFGQATINVSDAFRLTGGARYNWDRASFAAYTTSQCPFGSGTDSLHPNVAIIPAFIPGLGGLPACSTLALFSPSFFTAHTFAGGSKSFQKFSWKASVEYDVNPDTLAYATVSTGYKAGGASDKQAVGDLRFFRPENDINYEAGIKTKLLDNKLNLSLTAFWTDYKDLQVAVINPNNLAQQIYTNAGKSRSRGVEFEYGFALTPSDNIHGFLTYLDAKFRDFPSIDPLSNIVQNFKGNRLPGSPKAAGRVAYSHIFDLGTAGTLTPTAQFYFQTASYQSYANNAATRVQGYTRSDLIIRYETENKHLFVEGFINNLEDKQILQSAIPIQSVSIGYFSAPRTFGGRIGFKY